MSASRAAAVLSLALLAFLSATAARADSFRCGSYLIRENMPADEIRQKCGEPDLARVVEEPVFARLENGAMAQIGVTTTQVWYYDRGPNQFVARIAIQDSVAREIERLRILDIKQVAPQEPQ